jgi:hypothetical protein
MVMESEDTADLEDLVDKDTSVKFYSDKSSFIIGKSLFFYIFKMR